MSISEIAANRYTAKLYDGERQLSTEQQKAIFELLRNTPSSLNTQPWHFHVITTAEGREQVAPAILPLNTNKVATAPMTIVLSTRNILDDQYLERIHQQEVSDGRFDNAEAAEKMNQGRRGYIAAYCGDMPQQRIWMENQTYIALGFLLLGAAGIGLHATPIEGFDREKMDQVLNLTEQGLHSSVVVTIGFSHEEDFNAKLPKSRLPIDDLFTQI